MRASSTKNIYHGAFHSLHALGIKVLPHICPRFGRACPVTDLNSSVVLKINGMCLSLLTNSTHQWNSFSHQWNSFCPGWLPTGVCQFSHFLHLLLHLYTLLHPCPHPIYYCWSACWEGTQGTYICGNRATGYWGGGGLPRIDYLGVCLLFLGVQLTH